MAPNPLFYVTILATLCIKGLTIAYERKSDRKPRSLVDRRREQLRRLSVEDVDRRPPHLSTSQSIQVSI